MFDLEGRRCLVTGGGTGIGRGIAHRFQAAGAKVAICGRREGPLAEVVSELRDRGGEAHAYVLDVSDARAVADVFPKIASDLGGGIDVLVNNAGVGGPNACADDGPDRWDEIMRPNVDGVFFCCREGLRHMGDGGRVINISSVLGRFGVPGYTAYCASKHAVIGFTKALALEVADRGITVNAICPGWTETVMAREGMERMAEATGQSFDEARAQALGMVPIGRIHEPDEVGALAVYLASDEASGMTAQALSLCGGQVQL